MVQDPNKFVRIADHLLFFPLGRFSYYVLIKQ